MIGFGTLEPLDFGRVRGSISDVYSIVLFSWTPMLGFQTFKTAIYGICDHNWTTFSIHHATHKMVTQQCILVDTSSVWSSRGEHQVAKDCLALGG